MDSGLSMGPAISALKAASTGMAVVANNVANANTPDYKAKTPVQEEQQSGGTYVAAIRENPEPTRPGGSNVDYATEAVNSMLQSNSYQANLKVIDAQNQILGSTLDLKA